MTRRGRQAPPECNACGQPIEWATTPEGDAVPVNPVPHRWDNDPGGNLAGRYDEHLSLRVRFLEQGERPEAWQKRRSAHAVTCEPQVEQTALLVGSAPRRRRVLA